MWSKRLISFFLLLFWQRLPCDHPEYAFSYGIRVLLLSVSSLADMSFSYVKHLLLLFLNILHNYKQIETICQSQNTKNLTVFFVPAKDRFLEKSVKPLFCDFF